MANAKITQYEWLVQSVLSDDEDDSCKEWPHVRTQKGYGTVSVKLGVQKWRTTLVHVAAFAISNKFDLPLPKGVVIRHSCDNPPCFRLRHLIDGSCQDNHDDMVARGRQTFGSKNPQSKLTDDQVREIHSLYSTRQFLQEELATRFGVTVVAISQAIHGKRWGHLKLGHLPRIRIMRH